MIYHVYLNVFKMSLVSPLKSHELWSKNLLVSNPMNPHEFG